MDPKVRRALTTKTVIDVAKWRVTGCAAWLLCLEAWRASHAALPADAPDDGETVADSGTERLADASTGDVEPPRDDAPERFDLTYEQLPEDCTRSLEDLEFEGGFTIAFWLDREVTTDFQHFSYTGS